MPVVDKTEEATKTAHGEAAEEGAKAESGHVKPLPLGFVRPVMIHRAVLGSVERIIAILTEHYGGRWPFWLSPRQCIVIPVSADQNAYAQKVADRLEQAGLYAEADKSGDTLNKKIRNAELERHNFILTVGRVEQEGASVNVRNRDDAGTKNKGATKSLEEVVAKFVALKQSRALDSRTWDQ